MKKPFFCKICEKGFNQRWLLQRHETSRRHLQNIKEIPINGRQPDINDIEVRVYGSAFNERIVNILLSLPYEPGTSITFYLNKFKPILSKILADYIEANNGIKIQLNLDCTLARPLPRVDVEEEEQDAVLKTHNTILFDVDSIQPQLNFLIPKLVAEFEDLQIKGSGWILKDILGLRLLINKSDPLKCGSYIPTPKKI